MQNRASKFHRGTTMIEVLVASLILGTCMAAMVSMWYFSFNITASTSDRGTAYNLGRQAIEDIKETGFYNTAEYPASSPLVHYYLINETNCDTTPTKAYYKVTTTVVSDATKSGSPVQPADTALRAVTVTVANYSTGATLYTSSTYLVRAGI